MQIFPLSEGSFTVDTTKQFIPFSLGNDNLQERMKGSLLVEIQPFAIRTKQDVLLLDTGLGFSSNGKLQIYKNLEAHGILPEMVTKVLLSHLHKDHAGGICIHENEHSKLAFPKATYYVQKKELEYALQKGEPSYKIEHFQILQQSPQTILLDGEGTIDSYIHYWISGAHCPFHQVFLIEEEGQTIFYGGDEAPQLQQMKMRIIAKYDQNGKKAMQLRREWSEEGKQKHWTFLFFHDIKTPYITF